MNEILIAALTTLVAGLGGFTLGRTTKPVKIKYKCPHPDCGYPAPDNPSVVKIEVDSWGRTVRYVHGIEKCQSCGLNITFHDGKYHRWQP